MIYRQSANPNATNSELDAKQIVYPTIPQCDLPVALTEDQISTILYILEGYCIRLDEKDDEDLLDEIDTIFEKLETVVDSHYDRLHELCKEI